MEREDVVVKMIKDDYPSKGFTAIVLIGTTILSIVIFAAMVWCITAGINAFYNLITR